MQVAGAFVPVAPSGPSSHEQCCGSHTEENYPSINRRNHKGHAAPKNKKAPLYPPNKEPGAQLLSTLRYNDANPPLNERIPLTHDMCF